MKSRFPGLQVRLAGAGLDQTRDLQSLTDDVDIHAGDFPPAGLAITHIYRHLWCWPECLLVPPEQ